MKDTKKRIVAAIIIVTILLSAVPIDYFDVYAAESWYIDDKTFEVIINSSTLKGSDLIEIFRIKVDFYAKEFKFGYKNSDGNEYNAQDNGIKVNPDDDYIFEFGSGDTVQIYASSADDWVREEFIWIYLRKSNTIETEPTDQRQPATVNELLNKNIGEFDTESEFDVALKSMITASWSNSEDSGSVDPQSVNVSLALSNKKENEFGETVKYYSVTVTVSEGENWLATEQATVFEDVYWTVNQYTISFNTDGGTAISPIKQDYGTNITPPTTPTKYGYTFVGWDRALPTTMPAENIVVTAKWAVATKNVSFDPNDGVWLDGTRGIKTEKFNFDYNLDEYIAPKRRGYDFVRWEKQESAIPGADESYKAIWNIGKTVTFKDGDTALDYNYAVGETITPPTLAERIGHTFVGWDLVEQNGVGDGTTDTVIATMGNKSVTYVAIWALNKYTVAFYRTDGELYESFTKCYGESFSMTNDSSKLGYTFVGWDLKVNGVYDNEPDEVSWIIGAENLEYREIFKINQYTITFDTNGGSTIEPITLNYGTIVTPPEHPTKVGCEFDGWDIIIPQTMPAMDYTITASWTTNSYTITFDTDGGSEISPIVYKYGEVVSISSVPSKIGYTFAGWDNEIPETMPAENLILKAKWTINRYTIVFDTDGGSAITPIAQDYGTPVTVPNNPTKEYHTFAGWDKEIPATMPAENNTIKALWNANDYTIIFDTDGGSQIDPITQAYGTEITKPSNPTKDGYTFIGWDKEIPSTMPAESTTITAKWEEITRKVSFDPDGGTWGDGSTSICIKVFKFNDAADSYIAPKRSGYDFAGWKKHETSILGADESYVAIWNIGKTVTFKDGDSVIEQHYAIEETVLIPSVSDKTGHTFVGWDLVGQDGISDGLKDTVISIMGNESITYVAIWEKNKYTVTFYHENGDIYESHTKYYGESFSISNDPSKTGHTFIGWDLIVNDICDKEPDTVSWIMGAQNLEYKEIFKINQYTITFNTDGGSKIESITQNYDSEIKPPFYPTKVGCEFVCWDINVPQKMPAKDLTITAIWNINSYTITFDTDGGSCISPIVLKYGEVVLIPNEPSKIGHTFAGWDQEIPTTMPAEDLIIKALWTANDYTIIFDTDGGSKIAPLTQAFGTDIPKPCDPTKEGYVFIGWDNVIPSTMPAENITITAIWEIATKTVSFAPNGGTWNDGSESIRIEVLKLNDVIDSYIAPKRSGYDFAGWQKKDSAISGADESYVAVWNIGKTATFKNEDSIIEKHYAIGESILIPSVSDKIGHTFVGWDLIEENGVGDGSRDTVISIMGNESIAYVAIWEKNKYTVTFYHENGDLYEAHTKYYGESFSISNEPSKIGYTFIGWDLIVDDICDKEPDTVSWIMGAQNLEYKEIFKINQYTITFNTNGGSEIAPITQNFDSDIAPPSHPTKIGCEFVGWDINVPQKMPAKDITLTAIWNANSYTIVFDTDGGNYIAPIVQKYGESVPLPNEPSKIGHTFAGWDLIIADGKGDGEKDEIVDTMGDSNISYVALWSINSYEVNWTVDGQDYVKTAVVYGESIVVPAAPVKIGYTFGGWTVPDTMPAEDITLNAVWIINQYTISFITNGGTEIPEITKNYGEIIVTPEDPVKTGYTFVGWDIEIPTTMPAENITISAQWTINSYKVIWNPNGGKWSDGTTGGKIVSYKYGEAIQIPDGLTKAGFNLFWDEIDATMGANDVEYVAKWSEGDTVTFNDGIKTVVRPYAVGETIDLPENPSKIGHRFIGWDANGDSKKDSVVKTMGEESIVYVALWEKMQYTVTFYYENGDIYEAHTNYYGESFSITNEPTLTGHTFVGWDLKVDGKYDNEPDEVSWIIGAENLEYREIFKINQYTITFDTVGGSVIEPITLNYGTTITPPTYPTKIGCEFDGWDIIIPQTMPAMDYTITARWTTNSYIITFDTDGGSEISPIVHEYGEVVSVSNIPSKIGYTFAGWDKEIPETMPAEDLLLKAKWTINQYTITFDTDGGNTISPIIQNYGDDVTAPDDPTKSYHTFSGWDKKIPVTMPAENVTIKALWNANNYTITFDTDGGSQIDPITQAYGTEITKPSNPTKDGYTFIGWDKEIPSTMPAENMLITAKWEEATKIVSFDTNGGKWSDGSTLSKTEVLKFSDDVHSYPAPTKSGYDFGGWQKNGSAMPDSDETYVAIWNLGKTVTFKDVDVVYENNYAFGENIIAPILAEKVGYTFVGWDLVGINGVGDGFKDQVVSVMGNESLVYVAIWQANEYTVYFYDENDELIEAVTAKYGAPFGISIIPTKTGHTFVGWDLKKDGKYDAIADAVSPTMGAENLEYREIFAIGQYTITFDSAGGSAIDPITQSYGTDIVVSADPTKEGYVFVGWDQGVPLTMPALNITLTARWEKAKYSISWDMNADGVIDDYDIVTTVEHGDIPALPEAEVPAKESTAEFSYVFANSWLPAIKPADGDATYTAQYDAVPRKYTVKFLNYDGTPLQTLEVEYGSTPVYSGSTPIKIDDKQYDYTFAGWSPSVLVVTKDATYTATYTESIKKYTVVWKNWDGSVLETDYAVEHGDLPKYNGKTPTKPATEAVNYIFEGWEPQISGLTGDVTYTATFAETVKTYSITWLAEDGSVIDVTVVEYGKIPDYAAPMNPSTAEYSYTFDGWNPAIVAVSGDATYTASYTATKNKYTVTWNVDGEKTSESYEYGVLPAFKGSTDKAADGCTVYSFTGWNKAVSEVVGNVEYIATYSTATVHISTEFVYESNHNNTHSKKHECCKLVVETVACTDALNDGNHKCDFCGADNIGTHIGGKASCKSLAKCDECGSTYGSYDENNHESNQIGYSDITKTTHDEIFACCNAIKDDNSAHNYVDKNCICGAKKIVTVVIMNGESVWETIESGDDAEVSVSDMPVPTPTQGYVFSGWYTEDGVRVDSETNLTDDMVLHAGYFSGDVDGDGTIEKEDVGKLTQYIVGQDVETVEDEKAFDINGDGNVTVVDSILLLLHISGKRPMTP